MRIQLESAHGNISLQIGDDAYYIDMHNNSYGFGGTSVFANDPSKLPKKIGEITAVGGDYVECSGVEPPVGSFIMFQKKRSVNENGLTGYYASVKMVNNSTDRVELFALSSEVSESSK